MLKWPKTVLVSSFVVIIVMLLASIEPLEWSSYLLHQAGTLIFMAMMLTAYRYLSIGTHAYSLSMLFLLIHIIGARYLYSYVPYDDWSHALLGFKLTDYFGWQRNMYDRLVHFSYGLLLFAAMYNGLKAILRLPSPRQLIAITLLLNMASSMLYELFEWGIAMTLSAEDAEAYNGQQGDMWDAHKDMALALLGGLISAVLYTFTPLKRVLR
nr:DUF2238 domain-containing protein [Psychrobacter pygoscelis]